MSFPIQYISSSVVNVNTSDTSKIVMLPPASTIQGVPITIRDWSGLAATNPIYVSTQLNDLMDNHASTIVLDRAYQSFRVVPYDTTHYAITANYTEGLMPYEYAIQLLLEFFVVSLNRSWSALAVGLNGTVMLAVTNGGDNPGFYVSVDSGISFSRYTERTGNFVSCAVSDRGMFVADAGVNDGSQTPPIRGLLYSSFDYGLNWEPLSEAAQPWVSLVTNTAGDVVLAITSQAALFSVDQGTTFSSQTFPLGLGSEYTGCAIGDPPSEFQDDIVLYISVRGSGAEYIYVNINPTEGGFFQASSPQADWKAVACSLSGSIVYALTDGGDLYKSTDTAASWNLMTTPEVFLNRQLQCSDDGQILYGINGTNIYLTEDGAQTFRLLDPIPDIISILPQSGLSRDGLNSLFTSTKTDGDTALNVGRTRIQ